MKPVYFDAATYAWQPGINYREHPELYRVGKGEQGVLICEPYKSELLPLWKFKTADLAMLSSRALYHQFLKYMATGDFVGADLARKFLQMGYTRARRYFNYRAGRKYNASSGTLLHRGTGNAGKAESARIFYEAWQAAEAHPAYQAQKVVWKKQWG